MKNPQWTDRNPDYDQLLGTVLACEALERRINALNREKNVALRQARICGLDRLAIREVIDMRRRGLVPDDHVVSAYEGILERRAAERAASKRGK